MSDVMLRSDVESLLRDRQAQIDDARRENYELRAEIARLRAALAAADRERDEAVNAMHVAISAPMGVVPDTAAPFYDPDRYPLATPAPQTPSEGGTDGE